MGTLLAWQSSNWLVNDSLHTLGTFLTSTGAAGVAAVGAASIAAWQVALTRKQDTKEREADRLAEVSQRDADRKAEQQRRQSDDLWTRFEWVVDHSVASSGTVKPLLKPLRVVQMLKSIRDSAKDLPDDHLVAMIQSTLDYYVTSIGKKSQL